MMINEEFCVLKMSENGGISWRGNDDDSIMERLQKFLLPIENVFFFFFFPLSSARFLPLLTLTLRLSQSPVPVLKDKQIQTIPIKNSARNSTNEDVEEKIVKHAGYTSCGS